MSKHRKSELARWGPFWSSEKVVAELGLDGEPALAVAVTAGDVLGVTTSDGVTIFPAWQFVSVAGHVTVRPGLAAMFRTLRRHDRWSIAGVVRDGVSPELNDMSPLAWDRAGGDPGALASFARLLDLEWR